MTEIPRVDTALRRNLGMSVAALVASSGTLVCCVLPAIMVALGAGATLAGLVSAVPQLIWLSQHKAGVFAVAGAMLALSGALLWRARRLPCPADPTLAASCARVRRVSSGFWLVAAACTTLGALFAFLLPLLI
ncbi:MAG: hypothetical protein ABI411_21385 [Tahibacter sp.]